MSVSLRFLETSLGRKVLMSLTGLFLCSFLIVHVSGNLQLFHHDEGLAFNQYTVFMTTFLPIKIISYLLYTTILLHAFLALRLTMQNQKARPVNYGGRKDPRSSSWASRNMGILGTVLLVFLVTHMANFWYGYKFGEMPWTQYVVDLNTGGLVGSPTQVAPDQIPDKPFDYLDSNGHKVIVVKNLYEVVKITFRETWLVVLYLVGMIALAYHLVHGFQSSFQSLGIRHPNYRKLIQGCGVWVFGIIIPILFASMPVYFYFLQD